MEGEITMSSKEFQRMRVFREVLEKRMTLVAAAALIGKSYRQAKRMKARFARADAKGLVHGNRGKTPANALRQDLQTRILELHAQRYPDTNDTHFTELLRERERIALGRETVRKILRGAGLPPKRRRRPPKHRSRRQRKERFGQMIQWDGSPHPWFGTGRPPCCLLAAVDDATTTLLAVLFIPAESSEGYLRLLENILETHGIPMAVYHDQHSSLVRTDGRWTLQEQLQGRQFPTHVGRVLEELGIESIPAPKPRDASRKPSQPSRIVSCPNSAWPTSRTSQRPMPGSRHTSSPATTNASRSPRRMELPPSHPSQKKISTTASPSHTKPSSVTTTPSASEESSSTSLRDPPADPTRRPTSWHGSTSTDPGPYPWEHKRSRHTLQRL